MVDSGWCEQVVKLSACSFIFCVSPRDGQCGPDDLHNYLNMGCKAASKIGYCHCSLGNQRLLLCGEGLPPERGPPGALWEWDR